MKTSPFAFGLCALVFLSTGCSREVSLPLPPQHTPHPYFARVVLDMSPGVPAPWGATIDSGVDPADPKLNWRWITTHSTFSFLLEDRSDWQLDIDLTAVDYMLKELGPQTVTVLLNGSELGKIPLTKSGHAFAHYPVKPGPKPKIELQVAPCSPQPNRPPYCALIHSIGFSRELK